MLVTTRLPPGTWGEQPDSGCSSAPTSQLRRPRRGRRSHRHSLRALSHRSPETEETSLNQPIGIATELVDESLNLTPASAWRATTHADRRLPPQPMPVRRGTLAGGLIALVRDHGGRIGVVRNRDGEISWVPADEVQRKPDPSARTTAAGDSRAYPLGSLPARDASQPARRGRRCSLPDRPRPAPTGSALLPSQFPADEGAMWAPSAERGARGRAGRARPRPGAGRCISTAMHGFHPRVVGPHE